MTTDDTAVRERARLAALRQYAIVDTPPEAIFDGIAKIAARICDTPIAMVTFIDESRQSIKARVGIDLASTPRDESFCTNILDSSTPMMIEDATMDSRFVGIPLVTQAPHIRFYAGAPIRTEAGYGLGAVCVLDTRPRQLQPFQLAALEALADDVSARLEARRAVVALAESERLHRELFAANPQPMFRLDLVTGAFLDVNDATLATYGWSREEFMTMNVRDLWLPEDREAKEHRIERLAGGHETRVPALIGRHRRKDGATIVIESVGHTFMVGEHRTMLTLVTDVTAREAAKEAILDANAKFAAAQQLASVWSWEVDLATGALTGSDEMFRGLGIARGSIVTATQFREFVHPDDRARVLAARQATEDAHVTMNVEHRIVRADGEIRWVQTRGQVQPPDLHGKVLFAGTAQDITARRIVEEQLREQAALIEAARDGIMTRDMDNVIVSWNGGAERIFGWTAAEAIGKDAFALLHRDPDAFAHATAQLMETGHWSGDLRKTTKSGAEVIVEGRWTLLRHDDGRPKSVLVINTDVTERRKLEAQYLRAQRMESIGTLAGGIAHDLNNMLAPILMSIELLRMSLTDAPAGELLETIEASARRGAALVKQVLTFARGVEGQREDLTVQHAIEDVAKLARDTFPRAIDIVATIAPDLWWVTGDRTQLHQVLLNLAVNARDAMPTGGRLQLSAINVTLDAQYVAMTPEAKAGAYVVIQVSDTGAGIPEAIRDRIFEPFFTTKGVGEGTGLGLATVQAIVRSHGGFVTVYSEPGRGTTFKVYIPALDTRASRPTAGDTAESLPRGHGETVLVVDDEAAIRDITRQTLEAFGYTVVTAADGAEALATYAQRGNTIDVIITDIMMPVMDGATFIHAVRRLNPDVKIIAASGLTANGGQTAAVSGAHHFLPKPYTADTMLRALRAALGTT
jgi:two-component system cell cycle sensor histidine kinase/response regulator CckA